MRTIVHYTWQEREKKKKKDIQKQFNHHTPSCAISRGRRYDDASKKKTIENQVWPLGGVTYTQPE